jgi:dTDP-4-amino-4,6-dideoxygalactose transaminase
MIPRGAPYISWSDLIAAEFYTIAPGNPDVVQRRVESMWAPHTVACLSVRSGLDAIFQLLALPAGSEIVMSAITIPHILDILAHHQLVAVPVDIDVASLSIRDEDVRAAITGRTKAILVAHLFGSRMPLDGIAAIARERQLPLLEDCAQANDGTGFRGHPEAAVSMFSFGTIKRQTALGGALFRFRNPAFADQVRRLLAKYPRQTALAFWRRIATMSVVKALVIRPVFNAFVKVCRMRGADHDKALGTALRGFKKGDLITHLRHQPSIGLLRLLERRLGESAAPSIVARMNVVAAATAEFPELNRVGRSAERHTHWLFPIMAAQPDRLMRQLWSRGIDATCGASNLTAVPAPAGRRAPLNAERFMHEVLYLPLYPKISDVETRAMARAVRSLSAQTK